MRAPLGLKIFLGVVILAVVAAVSYAIILVGSPAGQRLIKFDERRVSDLQNISFSLDRFWEGNEELPATLEELREPQYFVRSIKDPATEELYEYTVVGENRYELCAVFATDSSARHEEPPKPFSASTWEHGVGRVCFQLEAKPSGDRKPREAPVPLPPDSR